VDHCCFNFFLGLFYYIHPYENPSKLIQSQLLLGPMGESERNKNNKEEPFAANSWQAGRKSKT